GVSVPADEEHTDRQQGGQERRRERCEEHSERGDDGDLEQREEARSQHDAPLLGRSTRKNSAQHQETSGPRDRHVPSCPREPPKQNGEGGDRSEASAEDERDRAASERGADEQHQTGVGHDEDREREERAEVLADEILTATDGSREDREDGLLLE